MATEKTLPPPSAGNVPANWEEHQADQARRRKAREANRLAILDCCDAGHAARLEAQKPTYEWRVECTVRRPDGKGRVKKVERSEKVIAHTESDAWAYFCDAMQDWPSPRDCERRISKLGKPSNARD